MKSTLDDYKRVRSAIEADIKKCNQDEAKARQAIRRLEQAIASKRGSNDPTAVRLIKLDKSQLRRENNTLRAAKAFKSIASSKLKKVNQEIKKLES